MKTLFKKVILQFLKRNLDVLLFMSGLLLGCVILLIKSCTYNAP